MLEAIHLTPALRMQDSHNRSAMGGLLERASIYELGECNAKGGHGDLRSDYWFFSASPLVLLCVWRRWCCSELLAPWYTILLWRIVAGAYVLNWLQPVCISGRELCSMPRKRGVPRRGSAWYARKEQRQRREQLERALVMATSMLRQKARAEEKALLSTIAEKEIGCSSLDTVKLEDSTEQLYPACIVEEDLTLEDLTTMEAPSDRVRSGSGDGNHISGWMPIFLVVLLRKRFPGRTWRLRLMLEVRRVTRSKWKKGAVGRMTRSTECPTKVVTCMAFSSARSTCPWCLSSEATWLTWSIVHSSWDNAWTCFRCLFWRSSSAQVSTLCAVFRHPGRLHVEDQRR
jgi:hypothetical protein